MLSSVLSNVLVDKRSKTIVLCTCLVIVVGLYAFHVNSLKLTNISTVPDNGNPQTDDYATTINNQKIEIAEKIQQFENLDKQMNTLSTEIVLKEEEIAQQSDSNEKLRTQLREQQTNMEELQADYQSLKVEADQLRSRINENERIISDLNHQVALSEKSDRTLLTHYGLAVTDDNEGILFPIEIEIINHGSGSLSLDVSNAQFAAGFQDALRIAAKVASDYTSKSLSDKDVIVRLVNADDITKPLNVDGPSAGGLIAAMLIAGLSGDEVNQKVLITGIIKPDGSIGNVGGIAEKTATAIEFGATVLLVPEKQEYPSDRVMVKGVSDIHDAMKQIILPK